MMRLPFGSHRARRVVEGQDDDLGQPPQPQLERWMGFAQAVEEPSQPIERVTASQARDIARCDAMDGRQRRAALGSEIGRCAA